MGPCMCQIFLVIFVLNKISSASGRILKSGTFKYLHRHPKLKSCALEVLKENAYVGCRVHMQKGGCEGLNISWAINQTTESGYAYAKKQWVESSYIPPIGLSRPVAWDLPGVLSVGSKVETTVTMFDPYRSFLVILRALDMDSQYMGSFRVIYTQSDIGNEIIFAEEIPNGNGGYTEIQRNKKTTKFISTTCKITFLSLTESLMVLVDDQTVQLLGNLTVELTTIDKIEVLSLGASKLNGFKFIGV